MFIQKFTTISKCFFAFIAVFYLQACSSNANKSVKYAHSVASIPAHSSLNLKLPAATNVPFRGEVCFDDAGQKAGGFLYPAPNAAGLLAAIATHAVISDSVNESQKNSLQEKADRVLAPLKPVINRYSYQELGHSSLSKLNSSNNSDLTVTFSSDADQLWTVESVPVFVLSQGKDALILQNTIAVYATGRPSAIVYKNMIQVVSNPLDTKDLDKFWSFNEGEKLKDTSAQLFADSINILLSEILKEGTLDEGAYKTFRYGGGENEKMERGQLIATACNRVVIRTLRGWIMSVPANDGAANAQCQGAL